MILNVFYQMQGKYLWKEISWVIAERCRAALFNAAFCLNKGIFL